MSKEIKTMIIKPEQKPIIVDEYKIYRPGGNDTALVTGINYTPEQRRAINDAIMATNPNVEQVGFIDISNPQKPIIQMSGDETCGNAARLTAYISLNGQPGEVNLTFKTAEGDLSLRAGVDELGNAWAQMPIKKQLPAKNGPYQIVELKGITQVVTPLPTDLDEPNKIRQRGFEILSDLNLLEDVDASGVMFITPNGTGLTCDPVVWVPNAGENGTLFYETACGTGTAAAGIEYATRIGESISGLEIIQPSGLPITVSVELDENKIPANVYISGPVEMLTDAQTLEIESEARPRQVNIQQVDSWDDLNQAFEDDLPDLYCQIFSNDPNYNEDFRPRQVRAFFVQYFKRGGIIMLARVNNEIAGFGVAIPIYADADVWKAVKNQGVPKTAWYMADLGVRDDIRENDVATKLVEEREAAILQESDEEEVKVLMRTAKTNTKSQGLYTKLGYQKEPFTMMVTQQRVGEQPITDERIFMSKVIR